MKTNSEETIEIEPVPNGNVFATPGLETQLLEKNDGERTHSPFCTPGLIAPSTKSSAALVSTNYPLSKANSSSNDLEMKKSALVSNSDECFEKFAGPSSPMISSYKNLLKTPTPPEVTTEDSKRYLPDFVKI